MTKILPPSGHDDFVAQLPLISAKIFHLFIYALTQIANPPPRPRAAINC